MIAKKISKNKLAWVKINRTNPIIKLDKITGPKTLNEGENLVVCLIIIKAVMVIISSATMVIYAAP